MRSWRSRFIFTLLVFFAGENDSPMSKFNSEKFVEDFNAGIHKCLKFGKKAALHTGRLLKEKAKELRDA
ncbi:MAG: hypothetical protein ACYTBS_25645 [Planctomycetota bacterium]